VTCLSGFLNPSFPGGIGHTSWLKTLLMKFPKTNLIQPRSSGLLIRVSKVHGAWGGGENNFVQHLAFFIFFSLGGPMSTPSLVTTPFREFPFFELALLFF